MSKVKLDWVLFEKAAAAVKQAAPPKKYRGGSSSNLSLGRQNLDPRTGLSDPGRRAWKPRRYRSFAAGTEYGGRHPGPEPKPYTRPSHPDDIQRPFVGETTSTPWSIASPDEKSRYGTQTIPLGLLEYFRLQAAAQARGDEDWNNVPDLLKRTPPPTRGYNPNRPR